ncbi:unnamed protein product [Enterobius vermicularis]|uniref:TBC1 domain family member 15 n=1 Tax=Enterobius vermicularis TaxID=51028 RepID=A0A0N4V0R6_ENTVE|nr:unnamed protein product [Enterobius vermicularis]
MANISDTFGDFPVHGVVEDREVFHLFGVAVKRNVEGVETAEDTFVNGKLSVIEKAMGIVIEWVPVEEDDWELTNNEDLESVNPQNSADNSLSYPDAKKLKFSVDIKDLGSFQCVEPKEGKGCAWIRFISKDGSSVPVIFFRQGGLSSFTQCLQNYATLKRSAREANLILFTDERVEALEQSVSILNINSDFLSRMMSNPYATAMTSLGRVASFFQEQVIQSLLETDGVGADEQIKLMQELRKRAEEEPSVGTFKLPVEDDAGFELVTQVVLPPRKKVERGVPVTEEVWDSFKKPDGSFEDVGRLKDLIFRGGLVQSLRPEAWKYLLEVFDWSKPLIENEAAQVSAEKDYYRMKSQWTTISADQEKRFTEFAAHKALIEKDVARTDRTHASFSGNDNNNVAMLNDILMTYCMYNFDLGYVQAMNDFLSPLLVVFQKEVDTFWAFVKLMERVCGNFELDQSTMKRQFMDLRNLLMVVNPKFTNYLESHGSDHMYFCFRWILVAFKREFSFEDTMRLWEVLWTDRPCKNFLLLICVAVLDKQMNTVIENKFGLTEILKHINELSMRIDVEETLSTAEAIFHQLAESQDKLPSHICSILGLEDDS